MPYSKNCLNCERPFKTSHNSQAACTKRCADRLKKGRLLGPRQHKQPNRRGPAPLIVGTERPHGRYVKVCVEAGTAGAFGHAGRWILQHRLAMQNAIGRPLTSDETVHHIDGDTHNNQLENLQLRIGRHGRGAAFQCLDCGSHNVSAVPLAGVSEMSISPSNTITVA